ncbi:MAG: hypothetical protein ABH823_03490 [bacterium]
MGTPIYAAHYGKTRTPGVMGCFHRDPKALAETNSRLASEIPLFARPDTQAAGELLEDKMTAPLSAVNPWVVVHAQIDPATQYTRNFAATRLREILQASLAHLTRGSIEGQLKIDEGVQLGGHFAQEGSNGETVIKTFDPATGLFKEVVIQDTRLSWSVVTRSSIIGGIPGAKTIRPEAGLLTRVDHVDITDSTVLGLIDLERDSDTEGPKARILQSVIEGRYRVRDNRLRAGLVQSRQISDWERRVVACDEELGPNPGSAEASVTFMTEAQLREQLAKLITADPETTDRPGNFIRAASTLWHATVRGGTKVEHDKIIVELRKQELAGFEVFEERFGQIADILRSP